MKIYNNANAEILDVVVDDKSYRLQELMGGHSLVLYFALADYVEIPIGAYCTFQNETYTLEQPAGINIRHRRNFEYTVTLESSQVLAKQRIFVNPVDYRITFPLTARPQEHLQMFVDNMNRTDSGWTVGSCIQGDEKYISYEQMNCWNALVLMADTFETEFEIVGKTVSLHKVEYNRLFPLELAYGKGKGFKSGVKRTVETSDEYTLDLLFVQGGEQNIDKSTYGNKTLQLPPPNIQFFPFRIEPRTIQYDGNKFENEPGFSQAAAVTYCCIGSLILKASTLDRKTEGCLDCSEIYPKRVGTVTGIVVTPSSDPDAGDLYDVIDSGIPADLDYDACQIDGQMMTMIFQTGMLAGKQFNVSRYYHNASGSHAARTFLLESAEIDGEIMPNSTFTPAVGDKYAVFGCMLPSAYICDNATRSGASWDMFREGVKYLHEHSIQKFNFHGDLDEYWVRTNWNSVHAKIRLGGDVLFLDESVIGHNIGFLTRITSIKDYINNPCNIELELSNTGKKKSRRRRFWDYFGIADDHVSAALAAQFAPNSNQSINQYYLANYQRTL